MRSLRNLFLLVTVAVTGCTAASDRGETVGSTSSANSYALPITVLCGTSTDWNGDTSELLVADAIASCSALDDGISSRILPARSDQFLQYLYGQMAGSILTLDPSKDLAEQWRTLRTDPAKACPAKFGTQSAAVVMPRLPSEHLFVPPPSDPFYAVDIEADADLNSAGFNLCVAQVLRQKMPGTASSEALFFTEAEQRGLLETIRERVQIAMVQYALLGEAFATPEILPSTDKYHRIPILTHWAQNAAPDVLKKMGGLFGEAVQLHSIVTEEMAGMLARSRSAHSDRGGTTTSPSEESWGAGSWYQRTMALLNGGDPIAAPQDAPWANPLGANAANIYPGTYNYKTGNGHYDWPTKERAPYVTTDISEPQIQELLAQARRFDEVSLVLGPDANGCTNVDVAASKTRLYNRVEAHLRQADCAVPAGTACPQPSDVESLVPTGEGDASFVLWKKHRITPDHANTLVRYLRDIASLQTSAAGACVPAAGEYLIGALDVVGTGPVMTTTNGLLHIDAKASFATRSPAELAPAFTRNASWRAPYASELNSPSDVRTLGFDIGFNPFFPATEAKRTMGAIPAQVATRDMVLSSLDYLHTNPTNAARLGDYFANARPIIDVLGASVGTTTTSVRSSIAIYSNGEVDVGSGGPQVTVTHAADDTFWSSCAVGNVAACAVFALQQPYAANLASFPDSKIDGVGIGDLIGAAGVPSGVLARIVTPADGITQHIFAGVTMTTSGDSHTYVVRNTNAPGAKYRLIAGNAVTYSYIASDGQYFGSSGTLGVLASHQSETLASNPTEPAYDGFDLPNHWIPPFTAALLGGSPDESSIQYYLQLAGTTADDASKAVQTAVDGLVQQEQDEAVQRVAVAKSALAIKQERDGLCGPGNQTCDLSVVPGNFDTARWDYPVPQDCSAPGPDDPSGVKCTMSHLTAMRVQAFANIQIAISVAVAQHSHDQSVPTFSEYAGGSLQAAFIEQWRALRAPGEKIQALVDAVGAANQEIDTANAVFANQVDETTTACSVDAMLDAELAGSSLSVGVSAGFPSGGSVSVSVSYSPGPLIAQVQKCKSLISAFPADQAKVAESLTNAMSQVSSASVGLTDAQAAIAQSAAKVSSLLNEAQMADDRAKLEAKLTATTQLTSLQAYRRYRDYDAWRARAVLESARRYALAARRAIEARYVVDLSKLQANEAFVASPASWADDVYAYDLSLPAAVGLQEGTASGQGVYSNQVKDYVSNLQAFVSGYAASRPASVATNELDVVTLPGLVFQMGGTSSPVDRGAWTVRCPDSGIGHWASASSDSTNPDSVCGANVHADRARLEFSLDPWGRLNQGIASEPFNKRFNARWGRLAVNFVGTGIKDCTKAQDPQGCYSSDFIPYDLTQIGPSWITDYDEVWRLMNIPAGQIEGAKGIASEIWLDPLKDGWATSYVSAVARTELELQPLDGAYSLEFAVAPEVMLGRIERLQLLIGSTSWVKEQ